MQKHQDMLANIQDARLPTSIDQRTWHRAFVQRQRKLGRSCQLQGVSAEVHAGEQVSVHACRLARSWGHAVVHADMLQHARVDMRLYRGNMLSLQVTA